VEDVSKPTSYREATAMIDLFGVRVSETARECADDDMTPV
jgi:hypothetical protein